MVGMMLLKELSTFFWHFLLQWALYVKDQIPKYWYHGETVKTAFFGTYMTWNTFLSIMSNLQVSDSTLDLPHNHPNHDKLFKVRPFLDMMDEIFK